MSVPPLPRARLSDDALAELSAVFQELKEAFGFQPDSVRAQFSHLASLWAAQTAASGSEVRGAYQTHVLMLESFDRWLFASVGISSAAAVNARMHTTPSHQQRLREMALYLCLWGEASNCRFCPEVLCFFFECARNHQPGAGAAEGIAPKPADGGGGGGAGEPDYLADYVRPFYAHIFAARYSGLNSKGGLVGREVARGEETFSPFENYDDWNEAFWEPQTLEKLVDGEGRKIARLAAPVRWAALRSIDWQASLRGCKQFRELHSASSLLCSYERLIQLHASLFCILIALFAAFGPKAQETLPLAINATLSSELPSGVQLSGYLYDATTGKARTVPAITLALPLAQHAITALCASAREKIRPSGGRWRVPAALRPAVAAPAALHASLYAALFYLPEDTHVWVYWWVVTACVLARSWFGDRAFSELAAWLAGGSRRGSVDDHLYQPRGTKAMSIVFWLVVFGLKMTAEYSIVAHALVTAAVRLEATRPLLPVFELGLGPAAIASRDLLVVFAIHLTIWLTGFLTFCASTFGWYIVGITIFGTLRGIWLTHVGGDPQHKSALPPPPGQQQPGGITPRAGMRRLRSATTGGFGESALKASLGSRFSCFDRRTAAGRHASHMPSQFVAKVFAWDDAQRELLPTIIGTELPHELENRFAKVWNAIALNMFEADIVSAFELPKLLYTGSGPDIVRPIIFASDLPRRKLWQLLPRSPEFRRRFHFFQRTLRMQMPAALPVEALPCFSVLIPHYSETIITSESVLVSKINTVAFQGGRASIAAMPQSKLAAKKDGGAKSQVRARAPPRAASAHSAHQTRVVLFLCAPPAPSLDLPPLVRLPLPPSRHGARSRPLARARRRSSRC
jgi:hypothetical protein